MKVVKNLYRDKLGRASFIFILLVMLLGVFAPFIAPHDPLAVDMKLRYAAPSWEYLLGNDHLGRDILSRMLYGIRPSILWVFVALILSVCIGAIMGFIAGYFRGNVDAIVMRICDVMLSFPIYVITIAIVAILGPGLGNILIAFILMKWAWFARIIRTSVMQYVELDYVKYARAIGRSHIHIIARHILPVTFSDIAVTASSSMGSMILQISGLSFLGLGIKAPNPEWGMMLSEAREVMFTRPELMIAPGVAIVIVVLAFNFLSDSLQVALNPQLRKPKNRSGLKPFKTVLNEKEVAK
ncbi:staphylopine uptake ABC transporter permease subunit CntC [Rummeliibacillus suwonensis]|jgi:ABC-type dipeptide/oligopeptide/nickel transport systems, permease components|uniref:staphylopine uptake ABC transporter permease subunit CntC n=1 Tax=Rummeliibacillus suwonensis TaxID=1306154 RepID=UPI0011B843C7|nr:nickel/cobalt ABC transporter permease [Rummeliibacillus suwonensis]MBO2537550.1 ABC transporter permease [Rummeliibacillus suwonensis]